MLTNQRIKNSLLQREVPTYYVVPIHYMPINIENTVLKYEYLYLCNRFTIKNNPSITRSVLKYALNNSTKISVSTYLCR